MAEILLWYLKFIIQSFMLTDAISNIYKNENEFLKWKTVVQFINDMNKP